MQPSTCSECSVTTPSSHLGWLTITYSGVPDWSQIFCGSICLHIWSSKAMKRLADVIISGQEQAR